MLRGYRMFENLVPYSDIHTLNLDWIIDRVFRMIEDFKTLDKSVDERIEKIDADVNERIDGIYELLNDEIDEYVQNYINEHLSQFLLGAMYNEPNTSIKLQQAVVIGDGDHVYDNAQESIIVLEGR